MLSSGLAQCSQLLTVPIEIVEECISKAEFEWSTDVARLHSSFSPVVKHCKVMMPELLKRLSIEENKTTWCDSQLEELNTAWCAGLCRLLIAMGVRLCHTRSDVIRLRRDGETLCNVGRGFYCYKGIATVI
ncbi:hypothetical protein KIN20_011154 [Parelaphostrongylus tenuis]|uniref:Uncharacterized protein n=1 Tax=Parelaphostrongylus tenuis TaxID=148309 RepID=A0AAD5MRP0_PARTN|nr:hypothetical protein KIN20_011154 [Parelaphostrongylus tenuis]